MDILHIRLYTYTLHMINLQERIFGNIDWDIIHSIKMEKCDVYVSVSMNMCTGQLDIT